MTQGKRTWYLYVVLCSDETLYTGITVDVLRRLKQHNAGTGARYTSTRGPVTLLAYWGCAGQGDALRAERAFKALSRARKLRLVASQEAFRGAKPGQIESLNAL